MSETIKHVDETSAADDVDPGGRAQASWWNKALKLIGGAHGSLLQRDTGDAVNGGSWIPAGLAGSFLRFTGVGAPAAASTLILPNAATAGRVAYATATNTIGEDADLTFDGTILTATGGYKERGYAQPMGVWISPTFSAGVFTASGSMTWTVAAGDSINFQYTLIGKTMTLSFWIATTTIGGTPSNGLQITIPGSFVAAKSSLHSYTYNDPGTGVTTVSFLIINGGTTLLNLYKAGTVNWTAGTDNTSVWGTVTFEVQ